ncbi:unnamed protein product, partial [Laminaria digitata]
VKKETKYLTSKEMKKEVKVSACNLMHMREAGKLKFIKKGNAYYYELDSKGKI